MEFVWILIVISWGQMSLWISSFLELGAYFFCCAMNVRMGVGRFRVSIFRDLIKGSDEKFNNFRSSCGCSHHLC